MVGLGLLGEVTYSELGDPSGALWLSDPQPRCLPSPGALGLDGGLWGGSQSQVTAGHVEPFTPRTLGSFWRNGFRYVFSCFTPFIFSSPWNYFRWALGHLK